MGQNQGKYNFIISVLKFLRRRVHCARHVNAAVSSGLLSSSDAMENHFYNLLPTAGIMSQLPLSHCMKNQGNVQATDAEKADRPLIAREAG